METCINTCTQNGIVTKEFVKIDEDSQTRDYTIIYIRFQGPTPPFSTHNHNIFESLLPTPFPQVGDILNEEDDSESEQELIVKQNLKQGFKPKLKAMSTLIPPTPAANKSAEQHQEPLEQDSFNHLLYKVLRLTSEQDQDLNGWMEHRGIPNVHEVMAQIFRKPHALEDNLKFITQSKTCYIQSNVMISLSLMITYIKHLRYSTKSKYFGPFYYIQINHQDYDEWHTTPPEEEIHFQTPSKLGSPTTPRSTVSSEASESYITLTNFKKVIKRDASAYPIFKNERYYNTFIRHFKATAKAQGLNSLMYPNFTPGSDEHEQHLFEEQQDFLYSVLISSLKTELCEALLKDHEGDAQLILDLLREHHTGNSQYSRAEINRITKYLTNIKLDDTWRGTNESFLMHYNDQLHLLDSLVDSGEKLPDNARVTFLESAIESVPDL